MELPDLIFRIVADHILPGLPSDIIRSITLPAHQVLHFTIKQPAIEHFLHVELILLVAYRWRWWLDASGDCAFVISHQQPDWQHIVLLTLGFLHLQLERPGIHSLHHLPCSTQSVVVLLGG